MRVSLYNDDTEEERTIEWPNGWTLPDVGHTLELHTFGAVGTVIDVQWSAHSDPAYPHMVTWGVCLSYEPVRIDP